MPRHHYSKTIKENQEVWLAYFISIKLFITVKLDF